ncbi:MAG: 5'-nucleotidase [Limisphaerales bacterium]
MNPDLHDNSWMRGGTSLLWDADALKGICPAESVRSLRELLRLYQSGWPEGALKLINERTLVVAGLEAAMDTFAPEQAVEWLEKTVYPAILDFQEEVADGGREAALIFWLADSKRVFPKASENTYHWHCSGEHRQESIPIGRCIWNGAEGSVRRIITLNKEKKEVHVGLFHPRIS